MAMGGPMSLAMKIEIVMSASAAPHGYATRRAGPSGFLPPGATGLRCCASLSARYRPVAGSRRQVGTASSTHRGVVRIAHDFLRRARCREAAHTTPPMGLQQGPAVLLREAQSGSIRQPSSTPG